MSVRFWRSAGHFGASYKALFICISREICTVPSLYRPSTDGLIQLCVSTVQVCIILSPPLIALLSLQLFSAGGVLEDRAPEEAEVL